MRSPTPHLTRTIEPSPRTRGFVAWTIRWRLLIISAALLLAVPATWRTADLYLHLRTSVEELLPRDAASVRAIEELRARIPGLLHLGVVVDVGEAENLAAGERLLDDLAARIATYPPELARRVRTGVAEERDFFAKNAALYADLEDLRTVRARVEERRDWEVAKETGALLDEDEPPPSVDFSDLEKKYRERAGDADRFPTGRFSSGELGVTLLLVEVGEHAAGQGSPAALLARVRADLAALGGPSRYAPGMRVGFTGDVAITVEETSALMEDLSLSSVLVILAVVGVIVLYYRWWRSVLIILPPLLLGTVYTFALASLPPFGVTALNSNTAFLGSIIVGNGINFGIVLLARYVEERRNGRDVTEAMTLASWAARPGTLAAALAAGVAYASLGITEFRGFRQFGYIGGIGMVACWLLANLLIPPLTSWLDRGGTTAPDPKKREGRVMARVARAVSAQAGAITLLCAGLTVAAILQVRSFGADSIEYDLSRLRRSDTWTTGEGDWGRKMDALLAAYLTPTAILTDDPAEARAIATALRAAAAEPPLDALIASVRTLDDVVPAGQKDKRAELQALRRVLTPKIRSLVPEDKREPLDRLLGAADRGELGPDDLPSSLTAGLRERDGSSGRTVLVFPRPNRDLWKGDTIVTLATALRTVAATAAPDGRPARVAGSLLLSSDIFTSLRRDGPLATLLAVLGVMLAVPVLFRRSTVSLYVIGALVVGVLWLAALELALGVKLNFTNFIAYPITFGIGVDYAVNMMNRYVEDRRRDVAAALRSTGGAVVLCSLTTIIGYASLLLAKNQALFLFGVLAVLGEITCL
ncbi:MAG: MMPL family transporter, partial [Polyangiaceae bacterium]|nr:MMPL family transporter [Polyangiaceae bacterium]